MVPQSHNQVFPELTTLNSPPPGGSLASPMMQMARRRPSQPITPASHNTHNTTASRFNQWNSNAVPMDDDMDSAPM